MHSKQWGSLWVAVQLSPDPASSRPLPTFPELSTSLIVNTPSFSHSAPHFSPPPAICPPCQCSTQIALSRSPVPPKSWTQRTRFCLYLAVFSAALHITNQLLNLSSSWGLMVPFSSWSPMTLTVPSSVWLWNILFLLLLSCASFLFSLLTSLKGHGSHLPGFHLTPWLRTPPRSPPVSSLCPALDLHCHHLFSLEMSPGPWAPHGKIRTLYLLLASLDPS